jgi:hypothetical protein
LKPYVAILGLGLGLVAAQAHANPYIADIDGVLNEGYPISGGFAASNATTLTVSTPNTSVLPGDKIFVLASHIGDNAAGITASISTVAGTAGPWIMAPVISNHRIAGVGTLYAWVAPTSQQIQKSGVTAKITTSAPTDITAIIFDVSDGAIEMRLPAVESQSKQGTTFKTPTIKATADNLIIAWAAAQFPAANPGVLTPGFDYLNWDGLAAYEANVDAGSYSVEFAQTESGGALAAIFAIP